MHWTSQLAVYAAIPFHATIVKSIFRPGIAFIQPLVYRTEVFLTVSLLLGVGVRLAGVIAVLFTLHLWIGLYNDPTEWPWTYVAIICAHGMFAATEAGRSFGLDNLLRGQWSGVFEPPAAAPGLPPRFLIARSRGLGPCRLSAARATRVP